MVVPEWKRIWDEIRAEEPPIGAPGPRKPRPRSPVVGAGFLDSIVELFEKTGG